MGVSVPDLVGRDEELGALLDLVNAPEELSSTTVIAGEPGIGKTALWLAGLDLAADSRFRVLCARPSEAEAGFSFLALADILGGVVDEVLPALPPIQRRALEAALLIGDSEVAADPRAVAASFLGALRQLANDRPLWLAVDDVQWLDTASLSAIRYAVARLERSPVAVVLAVRGDVPEWVRRAVSEERLREIPVRGLSVGATHELLRGRLAAIFARPVLIKLWEASGGNPFLALELARALQRRGGTLAAGEDLPIPTGIDELLRIRLDAAGDAAIEIGSVVSALAHPTVSLVEAAVGGSYEAGVAESLAAGILELDGQRLRFTHPLLGSAVAGRLAPSRRRALHARLADVVPTGEERARHLALAAVAADRATAAIVETASNAALERGAPAEAAELAEQAIRLTPSADVADARRRLLLAAERHDLAGDTGRAIALLEQARDEVSGGGERAEVLVRLADVQDDPHSTLPLYDEALREAAEDDTLTATIHIRLALAMAWSDGAERGLAHAEHAVLAASRTGDPELECRALATYSDWRFRAGRGIQRAEMDRALALERSLVSWPLDRGPADLFSRELVWVMEFEAARSLLHELRTAHRNRNDADGEATATWWLSLLEWRAGNWDEAERYAAASFEIRTQLGQVLPNDGFPRAVIAAHRGRVEEARAGAERDLAEAKSMEIEIAESGSAWILGFLELSLGDPNAALPHLRRAYGLRSDFMLEPGQRLELGDLLESLVGVGRLDEAHEVLVTWEERAARLDRSWALAILARGRGLLNAAGGDFDDAFASFEDSLRHHAKAEDPFQRARTVLALGATQRRAKRRAAARESITGALAVFDHLGAPLWAERARAELGRIGGRSSSRGELTENERRIAELVAEGHTNREVAAALFVTEHTVEAALTRIYRKLGVRSRGELTVRLRANVGPDGRNE